MKRFLVTEERCRIFDGRLKGCPFILRIDRWVRDATNNIEIVVSRLLPKKREDSNAVVQDRIGGNEVEFSLNPSRSLPPYKSVQISLSSFWMS